MFNGGNMQLDLISPDISAARLLRDEGMQRAIGHADSVDEGWSDRAYSMLVDFLARSGGRAFFAEEIRIEAEAAGFPAPPDRRAWGAVVNRAVRAGVVRRIGYGPQQSPNSHCAPKSIWVATRVKQ